MSSAKGCPNGGCAAHKKKTLFKDSMNYCPQCGAELVAVCKSKGCYTFLDDPSRKLCARCEAKRADKVDEIKKKGAAASSAVLVVGAMVATKGKDALSLVSKFIK